MHPRQTNEQPLYTEILWEWRAFGRHIDTNLQRIIENLPKRFGKPTKLQDRYLWIPNCKINLKLRGDELRIKRLLKNDSTSKNIQQWITQSYHFPISINVIGQLVGNTLNLDELSSELEDQKIINKNKFLSILESLPEMSKLKKNLMITVKKDRELYLWHGNNHGRSADVTIEIAKISEPESLYSVSIEHQNIDSIKSALSYLNISVNSHPGKMKDLSYLECLKYWFDGRKLF
jgi:hypothetical protein